MSCIPHCRPAQNKLGTMGFTARLPSSLQRRPRILGRSAYCGPPTGGPRYTLLSLLSRPCSMAHTTTHSLLTAFRCCHCIGSTWSWQVTEVQARALSSGNNAAVSSTFNTNVEELASIRASTTRPAYPSPSNCPNVSSGGIGPLHPFAVKLLGATRSGEVPRNTEGPIRSF